MGTVATGWSYGQLPTPASLLFSFLFSGSRSAGLVFTGILQGLHQSRLC